MAPNVEQSGSIGTEENIERISLNVSEKSFWIQVVTENNNTRIKDCLLLLIVTLPPLFVVIALCGISLRTGHVQIQDRSLLANNLRESDTLGELAENLAEERGITCFYLSY